MTNYIPEQTLTELRSVADIVDVISDVVLLKKAGKDYVGLCPFHQEKTPSFTVSPEKQIFYCFGCGTGGSVFNFLMKHEALSFPEAVRALGRRYGVAVPERDLSPEQRRQSSERERLLEINRTAAAFFRWTLLKSPKGENARQYLHRRGITAETLNRFHLGYAPAAWDGLIRYFRGKDVPPALLEKAGLIIPRKSGSGWYDRFRDRVIFPIVDVREQMVAFGGRVMDDSLPKYLNSPDTPVFNKRRTLYGLHTARRQARETGEIYLVEGYFDVLSLHQHGIENVVATLGTALGPDHLRLLKGYVRQAVLVYDSDQAGIRAALRSVDIFQAGDMDARVLILPQGDDPDSFVRKNGRDGFLEAATHARGLMAFLADEAIRRHGHSVTGKLRVMQEMAGPLNAFSDPVVRTLYIRQLAEQIGVNEAMVMEKIQGFSRGPDRPPEGPVSAAAPARSGDSPRSSRNRMERKIIAMMLQFSEMIPEIRTRNLLTFFETAELKRMGERILAGAGDGVTEFLHLFEGRERNIAAALSIAHEPWSHESCLRILDQFESSRKRKNHTLLQKIEAARQQNDQALLLKLLKEKQSQARQRE